ncbi:MAG: hypothetical protein ACK5RL_01195 [Acidimicrobiales bacterium]
MSRPSPGELLHDVSRDVEEVGRHEGFEEPADIGGGEPQALLVDPQRGRTVIEALAEEHHRVVRTALPFEDDVHMLGPGVVEHDERRCVG